MPINWNPDGQASLFAEGPAGFRLFRFEVYNWGGFHNRIWNMNAEGHSTLLTGSNGSGKSTLVDGLLTLLVSPQIRAYNQASGAGRKRERDLRSYVRGAWQKTEGDEGAKTLYLRDENVAGLVLAVFHDSSSSKSITLAQYHAPRTDQVKSLFVVSGSALNLQDHFSAFKDLAALRKRLCLIPETKCYDSFSSYMDRFQNMAGLRSEKALELFNQTVAVKEVGNLNSFVRQHMLEPGDSRERVDELLHSFDSLNQTHDAIRKAREQLEILAPLIHESELRTSTQENLQSIYRQRQGFPRLRETMRLDWLAKALIDKLEEASLLETALQAQDSRLVTVDESIASLDSSIRQDSAGQRLRELDRELEIAKQERARIEARREEYSQWAQVLQIALAHSDNEFSQNRSQAQALLAKAQDRILALDEELANLQALSNELKIQRESLQSELDSLRKRKSQIPMESLRLREQLAMELDVNLSELPFAGELLRVRSTEKAWEGALERLLHDFSLRLLVPKTLEKRLLAYVDRTHLGRKLVWHVWDPTALPGLPRRESNSDVLPIDKLEIRQEIPQSAWLEHRLRTEYNFVCFDEVEDFRRHIGAKAITQGGLVKRGGDRHEKDDRHPLNDPRHFVMGWDNLGKIRLLEEDLRGLESRIQGCTQDIEKMRRERKSLETSCKKAERLLEVLAYTSIDVQSCLGREEALQSQRQALHKASEALRALEEQLAAQRLLRSELRIQRDQSHGLWSVAQNAIKEYGAEQIRSEDRLEKSAPADLGTIESLRTQVTRLSPQRASSLLLLQESIERVERDLQSQIMELEHEQAKREGRIEKSMQKYLGKWPGEDLNLQAKIEYCAEFREIHQRVQGDDLPKHEARFQELLNEKMLQGVSFFHSRLEQQREEIEERIRELNGALGQIPYTPNTFIRLACARTPDREIAEFLAELRACLPDHSRKHDMNYLQQKFSAIHKLVQNFRSQESWTRKVTDVRQWLSFAASEIDRETGVPGRYYSDSGGLSGGEKAKLAFTILGSAIAYQYGLTRGDTQGPTFRFVVIDEAFSKSDDANSKYAMNLFRELGLQLMVVTPMDKTHVVLPFIESCHLVTKSPDARESRLTTISRAELERREQEL